MWCKFIQHGGLITRPGADFKNTVVLADPKQMGHVGHDEGLRNRLALADRKRRIDVGVCLLLPRHKPMPRNVLHGLQNLRFVESVNPTNPIDHLGAFLSAFLGAGTNPCRRLIRSILSSIADELRPHCQRCMKGGLVFTRGQPANAQRCAAGRIEEAQCEPFCFHDAT